MLYPPVKKFQALPKLRLMFWAAAPLYEPEKTRELPTAAVRAARFWPRTIPEMVLLERRFVPIEVLATTLPLPLVERMELVRLVKPRFVVVAFVWIAFVEKRFVVVAEVPVALTKVKFVRVEEEETKRLVVVAVPNIVRP